MRNKIAIIGAGYVGSTIAYALMNWGLSSEIVLIDVDKEKAEGQAMDLNHGSVFLKPVEVRSGGYEECRDATAVVVTAGAKQDPGQTRLDLVQQNTALFQEIIPDITRYTKDAIILVVSNPVDILTYVAARLAEVPPTQVIGSGTVLDTSRLRYLLGNRCKVNASNVHGYVIGEHGDKEVPAWSCTRIGALRFEDYCRHCPQECNREGFKDKIAEQVKNAAYEVIDRKGATNYAVGLAVTRILEAILRNEHTMLTVSTVLKGQYGLEKVALSLPTKLGREGVEGVFQLDLATAEEEQFVDSGNSLRDIAGQLDL